MHPARVSTSAQLFMLPGHVATPATRLFEALFAPSWAGPHCADASITLVLLTVFCIPNHELLLLTERSCTGGVGEKNIGHINGGIVVAWWSGDDAGTGTCATREHYPRY